MSMMRYRGLLALVGLFVLAGIPCDLVRGQRGGRAAAAGRSRGTVVGPYGGGGTGYRSGAAAIGPAGGSRTAGTAGGSYTTGRGTTIDYAGAGRTATGPGGVSAGRGVGGVQVTTPGGQTATRVGSVGGVQGPGGAAVVGGRSVGATSGPFGSGVAAARGGAAIGPGGAVGGVSRSGIAANPYGAYGSTSRGLAVAGPAGHYTAYRSSTALRTQSVYVRAGFTGYRYFNAGWHTAHPGAWRAAAWPAGAYWRWAPYATVAVFCGYPAVPVVYDYGSTVVYQDNRVYYNGEPVATAEEYATQALDLATAGQAAKPAEQDEWQPLGVFALVQGEGEGANNIFQLAINKNGVIRGNYYNSLTDTSVPIYGSVDKRAQRAAWIIGDKKDTVYETGMGNLSLPETSLLVHYGKDRTQQWTLVRLEAPAEMK
jgi:hypothetical protein